jgi:hypothetical protein
MIKGWRLFYVLLMLFGVSLLALGSLTFMGITQAQASCTFVVYCDGCDTEFLGWNCMEDWDCTNSLCYVETYRCPDCMGLQHYTECNNPMCE